MMMNKMKNIIEFKTREFVNNKGISEEVFTTVFKAYAHIDTVWAKDYQTAISSGTQNRIKFTIRYVPVEINNKMHILFKGERYDIKEVYPDFNNHKVITIMAERVGL